jgi:hypothetical protein
VTEDRWAAAALSTKLIVFCAAGVFAYGTVVHAVDLADRGLSAYAQYPTWLSSYFTSLIILDALAAILLVLRRRSGLVLGIAVLVTDAAANGYANYFLYPDDNSTTARAFQAVTTVLALALFATSPKTWPLLR